MKTHISFSSWNNYMDCEAQALARDKGDYRFDPTESMLESKFVEELILNNSEETIEKFLQENPEAMNSRTKAPKAKFLHAMVLAEEALKDEIFMTFLQGDTQVKLKGVVDGMDVLGFADVINPNYISDLKVMANFDRAWDPVKRARVSFVTQRRYAVQGAIYLELYRQMYGKETVFFIPAMSKEKVPRRTVITFASTDMDLYLDMFRNELPRIKSLREGKREPKRCGDCEYCRMTAVTEIIDPVYVGMSNQEREDYYRWLKEGGDKDDY